MTEKEAQGNPAQSSGWAVGEMVNPDAYPNGELLALEEQKRMDTATWEDAQNRSPMDNENPAQPGGWGVAPGTGQPIPGQGADAGPPMGPTSVVSSKEIVARVFQDRSIGKYAGAKVLLGTSEEDHQLGEIVAMKGDKFWVAWRDGEDSVEKTEDYELIIREDEG
jgi:hypothetical protein